MAVTSSAFHFLRLTSRFGEMSSLVLFFAPFSLRCAWIFLFTRHPEGTELPAALGSVFSVPISSLFALSEITFLFCWTLCGCFLESV